jgi:hypothetical protein
MVDHHYGKTLGPTSKPNLGSSGSLKKGTMTVLSPSTACYCVFSSGGGMTKICHLLSIIHKINKNQACTTMNYGLNFNNSEMNNCHQLYRLSIKKMEL